MPVPVSFTRCGSVPSGFLRCIAPVVVFMAGLGLSGCGPENELGRLPFSGTVTLNGQPLEQGSISFEPTQPGEGTTRSGTTIVDGEFAVETLDGLPPGEYLVRINAAGDAATPVPEDQAPGMVAPPRQELIPPEYNVRSDKTITITEGEENHFTFDIQASG